jgi:predicted nucleic-acid-binding protein
VIGLDTNVLVRYLVQDHPAQSRAAKEVMESLSSAEPGWISVVVLAELVWSLKKTYRLDKNGIMRVLEGLIASKDLVFENGETVQHALALHRNTGAGFADCLLSVSAKSAGCKKVVTFDRVAARDIGMERITE